MTATAYLQQLSGYMASVEVTDGHGPVQVDEALSRLVASVRASRNVYLIGNGGSASIVAHAQNDLVKAGNVRALVFQDAPTLTAFANDLGYEHSYDVQLRRWVEGNDLVIAVSSSGMSMNVDRAVLQAIHRKATVVTFTGFEGDNVLRQRGELNFYVPSTHYGFVELTHAALLHYLTDEVARA